MSLSQFPELYVLRHGETEWNLSGRMQGRANSPLTPKGIKQAGTQRAILEAAEVSSFEVISSPQLRALRTAVEIFEGLATEIRTDARLCEIDVGNWQGCYRAELLIEGDPKSTVDGPLALYEQADGGEGFRALRARCETFLRILTGPSVLITHGITSRMLRLVALDLPTESMIDLPGGQGVVFHLKDGTQTILR